jgi:hypothetical protein
MPNFHVHWVVAWQALDGIPGAIRDGRDAYLETTRTYADRLRGAFDDLSSSAVKGKQAAEAAKKLFETTIPILLKKWRGDLYKTDSKREDVTCFSAYMLGACGPDFWTVPAKTGLGVIPDFGSIHFDLGHYNRTHQQFRCSIENIGGSEDAQSNLERSYFLGMATHVAADLVVHELVNVSAGAYNLLKKKNWQSEHPGFPNLKLWNAHNKVEHFWDSFVRYRYLGDLSDELLLFDPGQRQWTEPLGFPLAETLVQRVRKWENADVRDAVLAHLLHENKDRRSPDPSRKTGTTPAKEAAIGARVLIETPLVFTAIACDRILGEVVPERVPPPPLLQPFIYDRVVNKAIGAYPRRMMFDDATQEAYEDQMTDDRWFQGGSFNEVRRLRYFGTERNRDASPFALNFLNFVVCPDLDRLIEEGPAHPLGEAFSDLRALKEVGNRAVGVAKAFANRLLGAYQGNNPDVLGDVGMFWNLDTGLGLEVQAGKTTTEKEVLTRLDFVHVLAARIKNPARKEEGDLGYVRVGDPSKIGYLADKKVQASDMTTPKAAAFPVRTTGAGVEAPFPSLAAVQEPDADKYLDRIRVNGDAVERWTDVELGRIQDQPDDPPSVRAERRTKKFLDLFFAKEESAVGWHNLFGSVTREMKRVFSMQEVRERITLELRYSIPAIGGAADEPGFFLYGDDKLKVGDAAELAPHEWLEEKKKKGSLWLPRSRSGRIALSHRAFSE